MKRKYLFFLLSTIYLLPSVFSHAQNVEELRSKIDSHSEEIKKLEGEIKAYQGQIEETGKQANTLQNTIKTLDINQKKISTEIKKTETNISKVNLSLEELGKEIRTTEEKITTGRQAIKSSIRDVNEVDNISLPEIFLGEGSLTDALRRYEESEKFNSSIRARALELLTYKTQVEDKQKEEDKKKNELLGFKEDLKDQNIILASNKKEKSTLLTETKSKEAEYKKILAQKQDQKEMFEKELFQFESQLKIAIDPNQYAKAKGGILSWPLDSIYVTQGFGRTVDAQRLYVSGSHNGVDFRASRGTPVKSALGGVVKAVGNTDAQKGCYSYGKWILIEHPNGLTSLYAHLDLVKVAGGQSVSEGEIIGYSGATGYATGPHLHFTLYASQGVRVEQYTSSKNCKNTSIPIASANAYLDPMAYFPPL